ncbi:MAG: DinB family protein [Acidobacteriota bacterium]
MSHDVGGIISKLQKIDAEVRESFGSLSPEQINWRPSPDSWSIGQCLDHLIKSNEGFYGEFDKLAAGTRKNSFWETWSPLSKFAGSFLVKSLKADDKKVKTIPTMTPPSEIDAGIVDNFIRHNDELAGKVRSVANVDWQKTVVTSPFFGLMTYQLDTGLAAIIEHEKRHLRQAKRVLETDGFPR